MRDVASEKTAVTPGKSEALSSSQALYYDDVPSELYRRIALRHTVGHKKYSPQITQNLNWRVGLTDPFYIKDRLNHIFLHLIEFLDNGDDNDDNLAGIVWNCGFLMEVERVAPKLLRQVIKQSHRYGKKASKFKKYLERKQHA